MSELQIVLIVAAIAILIYIGLAIYGILKLDKELFINLVVVQTAILLAEWVSFFILYILYLLTKSF